MKKAEIVSLVVVLLSFLIGAYFYPLMPEKVASHWGIDGQANGYMPKFWGLFLLPIISIAMLVLFMILPGIDPMKKNIEKFRGYFDNFVLILILFMFYVYNLTILWNIGITFDMAQLIMPAVGMLFFYSGVLMENSKRNWFIGVRTPWTISDDRVWDKTNKLAGKLFKASGIITILGVLVPAYGFLLMMASIMASALYVTAYSYFEYQRLNRGNMRRPFR
ncbi:MAG: DUF1648 domain-containing protein [Candidatus Aenigmatarchaeota archaeon]